MPNRYRFKSAVRILGIVFQFIFKLGRKVKRTLFAHIKIHNTSYKFKHFPAYSGEEQEAVVGMSGLLNKRVHDAYFTAGTAETKLPFVVLSEKEINLSLRYFYQKEKMEVENFSKNSKALRQSVVVDDIRF